MKKNLLIMSFIMLSSILCAQKPVEIKLWPNGAPNENGIKAQKENGPVYVAEPALYVYPAENPNGMAIIACPGGGYYHLATAHEGHDMAAWFNSQGITYSVLIYRMPNGHNEVPLSDAHQAIRIMREKSKDLKFSKLGIMGSSAGGHLASTAATHFDESTKPDFQILFYPVITMDKRYTHMGSRNNLLGSNPDEKLVELYCNEKQVNPQTPPAFIMHSSDDKTVPVENSINYYMSLVKNRVSASLHTYPIGGHGWGYSDSFIYKRQWTGELEKWLREINK